MKTWVRREVHTEMLSGEVRAVEREEEDKRWSLGERFRWGKLESRLIESETNSKKL